MNIRFALAVAVAATTVSLSACQPSTPEQAAAPDTPATLPEGQNEATGEIEPGIGAPPPEGGGVPGAASGNPAAAPAVSTPPDNAQEAQQTPE